MSSLTLPARSNPIDSFEDLLYSDFHHFVIQNNSLIHTTFEKSTDPFFKAIWDKVKRQGMDKSVLPVTNYTLIMQNQEMVLADDLSYVKLRVRLEFTTRSGESVLHAGGKGVYPSGLGIPMRKNAPYASAVNKW